MGFFLTDESSIRQREIAGIPKWHAAGYRGKGQAVLMDDVGGDHAEAAADIVRTILPEAKVYVGRIGFTASRGEVRSCTAFTRGTGAMPLEEFISRYKITAINNSTTGGTAGEINSPFARFLRGVIRRNNLVITGAAGNFGGIQNPMQGAAILVSGAILTANGEIRDYGSFGDQVDFSTFMGFQFGTSFAAPFLCGMVGLLRTKHPEWTQEKVYAYLKDHCRDMGISGKDPKWGWGIPILGSPTESTIRIPIMRLEMDVDGVKIPLDQPAKIDRQTGRTLVPIRAVAEAFGADVEWDNSTRTVVIRRK